jgi:hypothetical protein
MRSHININDFLFACYIERYYLRNLDGISDIFQFNTSLHPTAAVAAFNRAW